MEVVRSPESAGPKKGPGDLSVGPSIWKEVVRSPQSAGFIRSPEDLSVGPSIWREVVRRIYP